MDNADRMLIEQAIGGKYEMPDGRTFWIDGPVAREMSRRMLNALSLHAEKRLPPPDGGGPEPQCGYCAARFWTTANLRDHMWRAHGVPNPEKPEPAREDAQPYKDALHDLVMLKAQQDIGCVPAPTSEQWKKAWAEAEDLLVFEP